jgi:hypothetical protein
MFFLNVAQKTSLRRLSEATSPLGVATGVGVDPRGAALTRSSRPGHGTARSHWPALLVAKVHTTNPSGRGRGSVPIRESIHSATVVATVGHRASLSLV